VQPDVGDREFRGECDRGHSGAPGRSVRTVLSRWRGRGSRRRFLLPIDGVVSADHVTYDGNADEGHDYNDVEHAPYIIKIFPGCRG